jgi:hypothetical protein
MEDPVVTVREPGTDEFQYVAGRIGTDRQYLHGLAIGFYDEFIYIHVVGMRNVLPRIAMLQR